MENPLAKYRKVLLLAELVGIIHDIGKVSDIMEKNGNMVLPYVNHLLIPYLELGGDLELIALEYKGEKRYSQYDLNHYNQPRQRWTKKENSMFTQKEIISKIKNHLLWKNVTLKYLLKESMEDNIVRELFTEENGLNNVEVVDVLSLFVRHHAQFNQNLKGNSIFTKDLSDFDSMDSREERMNASNFQSLAVATVFGSEKTNLANLSLDAVRLTVYKKLEKIFYKMSNSGTNEDEILSLHRDILNLKDDLNKASAMTRLPDNDITVWDHGYMAGSLLKASIAGRLLGKTVRKFQILAIQYPGREFLTQIYRLPDFVGRTEFLLQIQYRVQKIIEITYSLGNLVYQDVNGMYFLIPNIEENSDLKKDIALAVKKQFDYYDSVDFFTPYVSFEEASQATFGAAIVTLNRKYESTFKRKLSGIRTDQLELPNWTMKWRDKSNAEVCQVCRRMPVEPDVSERSKCESLKYEGDKLCSWCKATRQLCLGNTSNQAKEVKNARFIDQIMDENHQVVLLSGEIGLFDLWLRGDYIRTTRYDRKKESHYKHISPSRIRRVIEEAMIFQEELEQIIQQSEVIKGLIFKFSVRHVDKKGFWVHTFDHQELKQVIYELLSNSTEKNISNIDKVVKLIAANEESSFKIYIDDSGSEAEGLVAYFGNSLPDQKDEREFILKRVFESYFSKPRSFRPENSNGEKIALQIFLKEVKQVVKARKVYGMADEFMYLLPASQVMSIVNKITEQFEKQFGRVKGRLSLNLGMIFADHKYPLYLVLDGGKRMLKEFREALIREFPRNTKKDYAVEGLKARLYVEETKENFLGGIEFEDSLFLGERLPYKLPSQVKILSASKTEERLHEDDFYSGLIQLGKETPILGVKALKKLKHNDTIEIIYAPNLIDFEYLDNVRSRLNLTLRGSTKAWQKREHQIKPLRKRPYILEQFLEFQDFNQELNEMKVPASALKNFEAGLIDKIQRMFSSEDEYREQQELLKEVVISLIMNINALKDFYKQLPQHRREAWLTIMCDGRFFDLMELRTFIQALPQSV